MQAEVVKYIAYHQIQTCWKILGNIEVLQQNKKGIADLENTQSIFLPGWFLSLKILASQV